MNEPNQLKPVNNWARYWRPHNPIWCFGVAIFLLALLRGIPVADDNASTAAWMLHGYDMFWDNIMPPGFERADIATPIGFVLIVHGRAGLDMVKNRFNRIFHQ